MSIFSAPRDNWIPIAALLMLGSITCVRLLALEALDL
jgi:hypothetical protein